MPSETHQCAAQVSVDEILHWLASLVDVETSHAAWVPLALFNLDNELAIVRLWELIVDDFGERGLGTLDLDEQVPSTLGELASTFYDALS